MTPTDVKMCTFEWNHSAVIASVECYYVGVECLLQNISASSSAEYVNAMPIDDFEGLFASATENELHAADNVVDSYTYINISTKEHQVPAALPHFAVSKLRLNILHQLIILVWWSKFGKHIDYFK